MPLLPLLLAAACTTSDPPAVALGQSKCQRCSSVILQLEWAAAASDRAGGFHLYDDPGCLMADLPQQSPGGVFFQDRTGSGEWIDGGDVWLARSPAFRSPQNQGWAAFKTFAAAQDAIAQAGSGDVMRFDKALANKPR